VTLSPRAETPQAQFGSNSLPFDGSPRASCRGVGDPFRGSPKTFTDPFRVNGSFGDLRQELDRGLAVMLLRLVSITFALVWTSESKRWIDG
jgi:hypothetical protein